MKSVFEKALNFWHLIDWNIDSTGTPFLGKKLHIVIHTLFSSVCVEFRYVLILILFKTMTGA